MRRKRQTKRRLKGGSVLGKHTANNRPNVEEIKGSSPPGKFRKKDKNKYLVRGVKGKNNYYLSETNHYSSGSDSEGNNNDDYTRGPDQFAYHEVGNEVYYVDEVNSGAYNAEELNKLKELYENRMTRKNWKEEFEDYIAKRR